ncbi:hypothetical protein MKW98_021036 [Papaver atlanticum]|uniref:Core-2/I-branching beta-1,6-N-acetylglucosaminyltransferase family protein n=1 Tax=Papaver atlanticum TaxID=357466 RepID=A0AAD4XQW0_9MAGN|nr:hypothetical protein MKW98_021036 [Papaver atlanticum]
MLLSPPPSSLPPTLSLQLPISLPHVTVSSLPTPTYVKPLPSSPPAPPLPPTPEEEEDLNLFLLAAKVNSTPTPNAPQKIAFLFLTTTPLPLAPLWELYFNQNRTQNNQTRNLFNIYIHADPSRPYNPPFSGYFFNRTIPSSKPTQRGSPSLIASARRLLSQALLNDPSNARFIILSTSCIPLHSFNFTYSMLFQTNKSFIEILKNEPRSLIRYIARGGANIMLPEIPFKDFRIGSQFFILNRHHAKLVVTDEKLWKKFKLPCVFSKYCYPEEQYFSTLLNMEDSSSCIPATLTHVDWSKHSSSHPWTYKETEIGTELIKSLRQREIRYEKGGVENQIEARLDHNWSFLFARKFSPNCLKPLLDIASDLVLKN